MAEAGLVDHLLGEGEADGGEGGASVALDPTAAAFAAREAGRDPLLAERIADYFERQSRLVEAQIDNLQELRDFDLRHLRARRLREALQLGFQIFLAVVALAVVIVAGTLVWDAATSRTVVVNAFKSPPPLAQRGLSGDVVAAGVLDNLQKLQDATRGPSKGLNTRGAWAGDVKIELPETGVSIGEVSRLLHERLGHDLHIDGDLMLRPDGGLALTVRGDGVPAKTFTGPVEDVEKLTTQAAEYAYGRSQPWQYGVYLVNSGRAADALTFLPPAFARASTDAERADLANAWGTALNALGRIDEAARRYALSKAYAAPFSTAWWKAWGNLLGSQLTAEREEESRRDALAFLRAAASAPAGRKPEDRFLQAVAAATWDPPLVLKASLSEASRNGGRGANTTLAGPILAGAYEAMHDPQAAARALAASDADNTDTRMMAVLGRGERALDDRRWAEAVAALEEVDKLTVQGGGPDVLNPNLCDLALAYAGAGREADAWRTFGRVGPYAQCFAERGDALMLLGRPDQAQAIWTQGVAHAPNVPAVYLHRGRWALERGDLARAAADLSTAAAKAPHWADPFKFWGDVLMKEGRPRDALARYDEALKFAPNRAELKAARAAAAAKT